MCVCVSVSFCLSSIFRLHIIIVWIAAPKRVWNAFNAWNWKQAICAQIKCLLCANCRFTVCNFVIVVHFSPSVFFLSFRKESEQADTFLMNAMRTSITFCVKVGEAKKERDCLVVILLIVIIIVVIVTICCCMRFIGEAKCTVSKMCLIKILSQIDCTL